METVGVGAGGEVAKSGTSEEEADEKKCKIRYMNWVTGGRARRRLRSIKVHGHLQHTGQSEQGVPSSDVNTINHTMRLHSERGQSTMEEMNW